MWLTSCPDYCIGAAGSAYDRSMDGLSLHTLALPRVALIERERAR